MLQANGREKNFQTWYLFTACLGKYLCLIKNNFKIFLSQELSLENCKTLPSSKQVSEYLTTRAHACIEKVKFDRKISTQGQCK